MELIYFTLIAFILDLILGDPHYPFHPVRIIGHYIMFWEKHLYHSGNRILSGLFLFLMVTFTSTLSITGLLVLLKSIHYLAYVLFSIVMIYSFIAVKSLAVEVLRVYHHLKNKELAKARQSLSYIVGRQTEKLNEQQIIEACIETVSENFVDGVFAPFFYLAIGGLPLMVFYKCVNTLDSMVGYKNEKYREFGKVSAVIDDVFNFIPARIAAFIIVPIAALFSGKNIFYVYKIVLRDRLKHSSPNSAHGEAAFAGTLKVQLGGDSYYFGKLHKKPYIGDNMNILNNNDIIRSIILMILSSFLGLILIFGIKYLFILCFF